MRGRPSGFSVGLMRDSITIQSVTETVDSAGQPVVSYTNTHANIPASYEYISGGETMRGKQVEAGVVAIFTTRNIEDLVPTQRIVHSSGSYGLVHVRPVDGRERYLELHARKEP